MGLGGAGAARVGDFDAPSLLMSIALRSSREYNEININAVGLWWIMDSVPHLEHSKSNKSGHGCETQQVMEHSRELKVETRCLSPANSKF